MNMSQNQKLVSFRSREGKISLDVNIDPDHDTVWLNLSQIADLFHKDKSVISRHIKKIFVDGELPRKSTVALFATVQKEGKRLIERSIEHYNLDVILSVGYRVNSRRGIEFRKWASRVLKDHMLQGYTFNQRFFRSADLQNFHKTLEFIKTAYLKSSKQISSQEDALEIVIHYAKTWELLLAYDHKNFVYPKETHIEQQLPYEKACQAIVQLRDELILRGEATPLFGQDHSDKLKDILGNIAQTFAGKYLYETLEDQAAHLFYFLIKDHPFVDGNKRIACLLLLFFLSSNNITLTHINDRTMVTMALLVAESHPSDKHLIIQLLRALLIQSDR